MKPRSSASVILIAALLAGCSAPETKPSKLPAGGITLAKGEQKPTPSTDEDSASLSAEESIANIRAKAEQGDAEAQCRLGVKYDLGKGVTKDVAEAAKWYCKAAEQGNIDGQILLGWMYANGVGVPKDFVEAVKWYRTAAEKGNADAQVRLGYMYASGRGVEENKSEALKWYRKAADQGYAAAQYYLGKMYFRGDGVPKDNVQAHAFLSIAVAKGYEDAKAVLAEIETRMTAEEIAKATELAGAQSEKTQAKPAKDAERK